MTCNNFRRSPFKQKLQTNAPDYCVDMTTKLKSNFNGRLRQKNYELTNTGIEQENIDARPEVLSIDSDFSSGVMDSPELESPPPDKINNMLEGKAPIGADYSYCTPRLRPEKKSFILERKNVETVDKARVTGHSTEAFHARIPINGLTSSLERKTSYKGHNEENPPTHQPTTKEDDMKYTDITHQKLKNSLDHIHGQGRYPQYSGIPSNSCYTNGIIGSSVAASSSQLRAAYTAYDTQNFSNTKYDAVLKIKDAILQEKESVILKLRIDVSSLQHQIQERDASIRQLMQSQQLPTKRHSDNKEFVQLHKKVNNLEQLLGKTECQLSEAKTKIEQERTHFKDRVRKLEDEIKGKDQVIMDTKRKAKSFAERLEKYKKRVESLERYLGDLPTMEETNRMKTETDILGVQRENMITEVFTLKNKLESKTKLLIEKENELKDFKEKEESYLGQIQNLEDKIKKLESSKIELGKTERDELEDYKFEVIRFEKEQEDAARMFSAFERRSKDRQQKHKEEVERLKEKVVDAEQTTTNIRKDLGIKQQSANKVHTAMVNLSSQNQQLMEEKLGLVERVKTLEKLQNNFEEKNRACLRLQNETFSAVKELKAVSQVLIQTADGSDPNLSSLLGVKTSEDHLDDSSCNISNDVSAANSRLIEVRQLRQDIEQLRTMLSNRYAENIGDNCTTQ